MYVAAGETLDGGSNTTAGDVLEPASGTNLATESMVRNSETLQLDGTAFISTTELAGISHVIGQHSYGTYNLTAAASGATA